MRRGMGGGGGQLSPLPFLPPVKWSEFGQRALYFSYQPQSVQDGVKVNEKTRRLGIKSWLELTAFYLLMATFQISMNSQSMQKQVLHVVCEYYISKIYLLGIPTFRN